MSMLQVVWILCVSHLSALKLRNQDAKQTPQNIFDSAFKALNNTLTGNCYYVTTETYVVGTGGWWGPGNSAADPLHIKGDVLPPEELPAFSVLVANTADIQKALLFAQTFGLKVNMKVNGHSLHGQSGAALPLDGSTTLIIWMKNIDGVELQVSFQDSCGSITPNAVQVGGGASHFALYPVLKQGNFTFLGGTCGTVSPGGGYILGTGLSMNQQRKYGLGMDNVLQFQVILSTLQTVIADRCSHPLLFKSLRGGGGGFAVTTFVMYPLWEGTQLQYYQFAFSNRTTTNLTKWYEVVVRSTVGDTPAEPSNNRWMLDPAAFTQNNWGYPMNAVYITMPGMLTMVATFLGSAQEAEQTKLFQDLHALLMEVPGSRNFTHLDFNNLAAFKTHPVGAWGTMGTGGKDVTMFFKLPSGDPAFTEPAAGNYNIPLSYFMSRPDEAARLLEDMNDHSLVCGGQYWYQFGGVIPSFKARANEVVQHPNVYDIAFNLGICNKGKFLNLAKKFPFPIGGVEFNHIFPGELDLLGLSFPDTMWGRMNYEFMLRVKQLYDPGNVFGCQNCVAWPPHLASYMYVITNPMYMIPRPSKK